jgi:hypothetical protein
MGRSTGISAALHAAILFFALVAFPPAKMERAPLIAIPVDLATPSEVTKIKAGSAGARDEAPLTGKPKEKKPEAVKEAKKPSEQAAELAPGRSRSRPPRRKSRQRPPERSATSTPTVLPPC